MAIVELFQVDPKSVVVPFHQLVVDVAAGVAGVAVVAEAWLDVISELMLEVKLCRSASLMPKA